MTNVLLCACEMDEWVRSISGRTGLAEAALIYVWLPCDAPATVCKLEKKKESENFQARV